jgi:hypothetical protein
MLAIHKIDSDDAEESRSVSFRSGESTESTMIGCPSGMILDPDDHRNMDPFVYYDI